MKKYYLLINLLLALVIGLTGCDSHELNENELSNLIAGNEPPPGDCEIGHRTQTPGGWGAPAAGKNTGYLRDTYFDAVFPNGLRVGCAQGFRILFTSAAAVEEFLPSGGKPAPLAQSYVDPTTRELKNVLASHIVALTLNNHFDHFLEDFGESEYLLCDLVLCSGEFSGKSVEFVLGHANDILGGCVSGFSLEEMIELLSDINENFVDGEIDNGFLCCPEVIKTLDDEVAI